MIKRIKKVPSLIVVADHIHEGRECISDLMRIAHSMQAIKETKAMGIALEVAIRAAEREMEEAQFMLERIREAGRK